MWAPRKRGSTYARSLRPAKSPTSGPCGFSLPQCPSRRRHGTIACQPVWPHGSGRTATPKKAAEVDRAISGWLKGNAPAVAPFVILYGGSVNLKNAAELLAEPELDGVLVGGASLDPRGWAQLVRTAVA